MARPIPRDAPVTSATLPLSDVPMAGSSRSVLEMLAAIPLLGSGRLDTRAGALRAGQPFGGREMHGVLCQALGQDVPAGNRQRRLFDIGAFQKGARTPERARPVVGQAPDAHVIVFRAEFDELPVRVVSEQGAGDNAVLAEPARQVMIVVPVAKLRFLPRLGLDLLDDHAAGLERARRLVAIMQRVIMEIV